MSNANDRLAAKGLLPVHSPSCTCRGTGIVPAGTFATGYIKCAVEGCDAGEIGEDSCTCRSCLMAQVEKLKDRLLNMHYPLPECTGPVYCTCGGV